MTLYVDTSRIGMHGIGRYSREVIDRLDLPWTDLGHRLRRPLPLDVVNPRRMTLRSRDVVYAPGFNAGITRARQFLTIHDLIHLRVASEGSGLRRQYYERLVKPTVKKAGVVFTVSEASKAEISEWLDDESVRIVNTGNGVSDDFTVEGESWRSSGEYVLYVGNLREHKNLDVVLDALVLRPSLRLVMVTSDRAAADRRSAARQVSDRVEVVTGVTDRQLASLYRGSSGLVMPSTYEGFGLPAAEAIACGAPVAYWQGCASVAEICQGNGIGVESASDAEAWADALDRLSRSGLRATTSPHRWDDVADTVRTTLSGGST